MRKMDDQPKKEEENDESECSIFVLISHPSIKLRNEILLRILLFDVERHTIYRYFRYEFPTCFA